MWCVCLLAREDFDVLLWSGDYGRTKLGTLNRMLNSLLQEGIDENVRRQGVRARTLAVLVRQLETVKGVRALEAEALHGKSTATMADMLRRTPEGLETPSYKVKAEKGSWEVREYEEFSVCSFEMGESPAQAGFGAFNSLAGYIFGGNQESVKMAMTTPVINHGTSNKMSFVMPSSYWKQNRVAPTPMPDSGVKLEERGGGMIGKGSQVAVMWFGGFASKDAVAERKASLKSLLNKDPDWRAVDDAEDPLLLQYNDPFVPPWKRRNEVVLTVTARSPSQPAEQPASVRAERVGVVSQGQTPPAALLELPKAKLEAVAANRRQWGVGVQVPRAKQEAREVNMRQWGIAEDPARDLSGDMTQKSIEALGDVEFAALERLMLLDLDGDGMVDVKEFKTAVCKTGITEDEAREMFRVLDIDANGSISFAEFVKAVQREVALKKPIGVSDPKAPAMMDFESRLNEIRLGRTATLTQKLMGKD